MRGPRRVGGGPYPAAISLGLAFVVLGVIFEAKVEGGAAGHIDHTVLSFARPYSTCDEEDLAISDGTQRIVWAYGSSSPVSSTKIRKHVQSGSKSINLRNPKVRDPTTGEGKFYDMVSAHNVVPAIGFDDNVTSYWYATFKIPENLNDSKRHIYKVEPIIGNADKVHHILLYQCDYLGPDDLRRTGPNWNLSARIKRCDFGTVVAAWAMGGGDFSFPEEAGYPLGQGGLQYAMMQIHYNNRDMKEFVDPGTGIRLHYSDVLRPNDAGVFFMGGVGGIHIPPGETAWNVKAHCPQECLRKHIPAEGVTVYSAMLHAHNAGRAIRVERVNTNKKAFANLGFEPYFDNNYQIANIFKHPVKLFPNESLHLTCTYNTMDRTDYTDGGLATTDEMCLAYYVYFPRLNFSRCLYQEVDKNTGKLTHWGGGTTVAYCPYGAENGVRDENLYFNFSTTYSKLADSQCVPSNLSWTTSYEESFVQTGFTAVRQYLEAKYKFSDYLDQARTIRMFWSFDDLRERLDIAIDAPTKGWVGVGFSTNGAMKGSDVVMGWADSKGNVEVTDRFASGNFMPSVDVEQNIYFPSVTQYELKDGSGSDDAAYQHMIKLSEEFSFYWSYSSSDLKVKTTYSGRAWTAWAVNGEARMIGADAVVCVPGVGVHRYYLGGYSNSEVVIMSDQYQDLKDATVSQTKEQTTCEFTRSLSSSYGSGTNIHLDATGSSSVFVLFAHGINNQGPSKHAANAKGVAAVDLSSSHVVPSTPASDLRIVAHAWCMTLGLGLTGWLGLLAIKASKRASSSYSTLLFYVHVGSQCAAVLLTIAGFGFAVAHVNSNSEKHFTDTHHVVGLAITLLMLLQALGGFLRPTKLPRNDVKLHTGSQQLPQIPTAVRSLWEQLHKFTGVTTLVLALANFVTGNWYDCNGVSDMFMRLDLAVPSALGCLYVWMSVTARPSLHNNNEQLEQRRLVHANSGQGAEEVEDDDL